MGLDPPFGTEPLNTSAPPVDPVKPKLIFSSNIPQKIADCVAEKRLFLGGSKSRLVDLSSDIGEFELILELNTLLRRNPLLNPTELVRKNLIFVAKKRTSKNVHKPYLGFKGIWRTVFQMASPSEIFVVSLKFSLRCLLIDLVDGNTIRIILHNDETYDPILRDKELLNSLKTYIKKKLLLELINNSSITADISNTNTILQDLPVDESLPLMKDLHRQLEDIDNDLADITLDSSISPPFIEKQLVYDDFLEFDTSDEEIKILHSDDSGRCTVDDEYDLRLTETQVSDILTSSPRPQGFKDTERVLPQAWITPEIKETKKYLPSEGQAPTQVPEPTVESPKKLTIVEPQPRTPQRRLTLVQIPQPSKFENDEVSPRPISVPPLMSPRDNQKVPPLAKRTSLSSLPQPSLRKKTSTSSFTMISSDDNHGLEYAFRDKSPTVPNYIREDRKFKFIKVGKVQKFVHLFEEQIPASETTTRASSRVASPIRIPKA